MCAVDHNPIFNIAFNTNTACRPIQVSEVTATGAIHTHDIQTTHSYTISNIQDGTVDFNLAHNKGKMVRQVLGR
jgi:hypothetical protein